jgi:hypothetical protein
MPRRKLERAVWHEFFDAISDALLAGKGAQLQVAAAPLGLNSAADWLPLLGIVYEDEDDVMEVVLRGMDHVIQGPREVYVEGGASGVERIVVVDHVGGQRIIEFRDPLTHSARSGTTH